MEALQHEDDGQLYEDRHHHKAGKVFIYRPKEAVEQQYHNGYCGSAYKMADNAGTVEEFIGEYVAGRCPCIPTNHDP